jgi:hypothetical protein
MVYPTVFLIHSATLTHTTPGGVDAYGEPTSPGAGLGAMFALDDSGDYMPTLAGSGDVLWTPDGAGDYEMVDATTITSVSCRFVSAREIFRGLTIVTTPRVLLPAGTVISEGDTLTSTEIGYAETFRINSVNVVYEAAVKTVSHISCDIAAVV